MPATYEQILMMQAEETYLRLVGQSVVEKDTCLFKYGDFQEPSMGLVYMKNMDALLWAKFNEAYIDDHMRGIAFLIQTKPV